MGAKEDTVMSLAGTAPDQADIEAINKLREDYRTTVCDADVDAYVDLWTDDGIYMWPNVPVLAGKAAIRSHMEALYETKRFEQLTLTAEETVVTGDWAFERGIVVLSIAPKAGGDVVSDANKYLMILRRQPDGAWKLARLCRNSNNPPPGEAR